MTDFNIIHAKDAEIGKTYLFVLSPSSVYKFIIRSISETGVGIDDERYPGQTNIVISGETNLMEYDEEFYNEARTKRILKTTVKSKEKTHSVEQPKISKQKIKGEKVSQNKNPRSKTIDKALALVSEGTVPDWNAIVDEVIKESKGQEADRTKIIFQAKMRYKWYTKQGKINPFTVKSE